MPPPPPPIQTGGRPRIMSTALQPFNNHTHTVIYYYIYYIYYICHYYHYHFTPASITQVVLPQ